MSDDDGDGDGFRDLSEWGAGFDPDTPNPEDELNRFLSDWLMRKADAKVFWDRERSYGNGTFGISTRRRPDLVISSVANNYAVEVKREGELSRVLDGLHQTAQYWRDIETGEAEYEINGEAVEIEAVLLATRRSPAGHLFANARGRDPRVNGRHPNMKAVIDEYHNAPEWEHAASLVAIRQEYRAVRSWYNNDDEIDGETGFGGLLSSCLDRQYESGRDTAFPAAFYLAPGLTDHAQTWQYIPFHENPWFNYE
jgi:hypothetical protein